MTNIELHFSKIANQYSYLRTTDLEPIVYIRNKLKELPEIQAADVGCGTGRYSLKLFQYLGDKLFLYCLDNNQDMLEQLRSYLTPYKIQRLQIKKSFARRLPLEHKSLDSVFTFNAVHHFQINNFVDEVSRVLKNNGYLFIYTRSRTQNGRNIWGEYFHSFYQRETRLYEIEEVKAIVEKFPGLVIQDIKFFKYPRVSSLASLVERARCRHYSTFNFYTTTEFDKALDGFIQKLRLNFEDLNKISWFDENVLYVVRKLTN